MSAFWVEGGKEKGRHVPRSGKERENVCPSRPAESGKEGEEDPNLSLLEEGRGQSAQRTPVGQLEEENFSEVLAPRKKQKEKRSAPHFHKKAVSAKSREKKGRKPCKAKGEGGKKSNHRLLRPGGREEEKNNRACHPGKADMIHFVQEEKRFGHPGGGTLGRLKQPASREKRARSREGKGNILRPSVGQKRGRVHVRKLNNKQLMEGNVQRRYRAAKARKGED